ncbi:MAG: hypothetical protein ACF8SC_06710 [Phycisphaerales bacterium JB037]|jgi:DNA-directed RNA polymerase specialized sigma24 family protein
MSQRSLSGTGRGGIDPDQAADLRRRRRRDLAEAILDRASWLPPDDRALIEAVYRDGRSAREVAALAGTTPRIVRTRLRRVVTRVMSDRFRFVVLARSSWTRTRRLVAESCVLCGRSMRQAAEELGVTLHTVRRHVQAIDAQHEAEAGASTRGAVLPLEKRGRWADAARA